MSADSAAEREGDLRRFVGLLLRNGAVIELRGLEVPPTRYGAPVTSSGYFDGDHVDAFVAAALALDGRGALGTYATVNPPMPALLARAANRVKDRPKNTTKDHEIARRRLLFIDIDQQRPSGICATNEEKAKAEERADAIEAFLRERGWPSALRVDTGNGVALYYAIDLPADDDDIVGGVLKALAGRFDDEVVEVDPSAANASRLARLPGTWNRKGDSTPDRPHRICRVVRDPGELAVVPHELLVKLAADGREETESEQGASVRSHEGNGTNAVGFDLPGFLKQHGIVVSKDGPCDSRNFKGGHKWILKACPFDSSHVSGSAVVMRGADGKIGFKCQHNSCTGRSWRELRARYDADYAARQAAGTSSGGSVAQGGGPAAKPASAGAPERVMPPPPRLDLDAALPPWLASAVRALAAWVQVAPEAVVPCILAHAVAAVGNAVWVRVRGLSMPLSLHFFTSLLSGSGKSVIRSYLRRCVEPIEDEIDAQRKRATEEAEEYALKVALWQARSKSTSAKTRGEAGDRPQPPPPTPKGGPRTTYVVTEGNLEGIIATQEDSPRGFLWSTDEADEIVGMLGAYGDSKSRRALDAARLRTLTESQPTEAHRARSNASPVRRLKRPWLALECDVQPGILAGLFEAAYLVSGTLARLLIHAPPALQGTRKYVAPPPEPGEEVARDLRNLLVGLWRLPLELDDKGVAQPAYISLAPDAERRWAEELERLETLYGAASPAMVGLLGHLRGRLARLAGALALIRAATTPRVELVDIERAIVIGRYYHESMDRLFGSGSPAGETAEEREQRELVKWIEARGGACTERELAKGPRRFRDSGAAKASLAALVTAGRATAEWESDGAGRPALRYTLRAPTGSATPGGGGETPKGDGARQDSAAAAAPAHSCETMPDPERAAIQAEARDAEDAELERLLEQAEAAKTSGDLDGEEVISW